MNTETGVSWGRCPDNVMCGPGSKGWRGRPPEKRLWHADLSAKGLWWGALRNIACKGVREAARGRGKSGNRGPGQEPDSYQSLRLCTPVNQVITLWARQLLSVEDKPWGKTQPSADNSPVSWVEIVSSAPHTNPNIPKRNQRQRRKEIHPTVGTTRAKAPWQQRAWSVWAMERRPTQGWGCGEQAWVCNETKLESRKDEVNGARWTTVGF